MSEKLSPNSYEYWRQRYLVGFLRSLYLQYSEYLRKTPDSDFRKMVHYSEKTAIYGRLFLRSCGSHDKERAIGILLAKEILKRLSQELRNFEKEVEKSPPAPSELGIVSDFTKELQGHIDYLIKTYELESWHESNCLR